MYVSIHINQGVRWLISDDSVHMNSNAYEMYVLSKCIRHKHQVKYIREVKSLGKVFYHFNRGRIVEALAREFILKFAGNDYDSESDDSDYHTNRHNIIGMYAD